MMGSQSSLDDAIANMCTDELIEQNGKKDSERTENGMQGKENVAKNELHDFLDEGDEDFLGLNY